MAGHRLFAIKITDSDAFTDLSLTAQALYFHLTLHADDEGFVSNPRQIQRSIGTSTDDLKLLSAKGFIIPFESGVINIKHFLIHNKIRKDRFHQTLYTHERQQLIVLDNGEYTLNQGDFSTDSKHGCQSDNQMATTCQPSDNQMATEDKSSQDKSSQDLRACAREGAEAEPARAGCPSFDEILSYCSENKLSVDPQKFFDYYERRGWYIDGRPIRDYKALLRSWNEKERVQARAPSNIPRDEDYYFPGYSLPRLLGGGVAHGYNRKKRQTHRGRNKRYRLGTSRKIYFR